MKVGLIVVATATLAAAVAVVNAAAFQDKNKPQQPPAAAGGAPGEMQAPKPGKEHEMLKARAGTWDATVKMIGMPEAGGDSKGTSVMTMVGDFWIAEEFTATLMGAPFKGRGFTGYDPNKKKWVGTWIDSMTTYLTVMEGTAEGPNKIVYNFEAPSQANPATLTKHRLVCEAKDNDHFSLSFFETGTDGKEKENMQIQYARRKS